MNPTLRILSLLALTALSIACAGETADEDSGESADALKNKNKKKDVAQASAFQGTEHHHRSLLGRRDEAIS